MFLLCLPTRQAELSRVDSSESSSKAKSKSLSPVTQHSESPVPPHPYPRLENAPNVSHLESNHRFYLEYYLTNISHHHYGLMSDGYGILSYTLLHQALDYDPLLYAMLGFSAYMHTVANTEGDLQDFLPFYSKSLSLLRQELSNDKKPSVAVLLTILQLTLLEVCKHFASASSLILILALGISGGLGKPAWSSESGVQNIDLDVYT